METVLKTETPAREEAAGSLRLYRWVLAYLKPYRFPFALLVACGLFAAAIELVIPKLIQRLVDQILPARDTALFLKLLALLSVGLVFMFGFMALRNRLERIVREKASRDLQLAIFRQLRRLGFAYYEKHAVADSLHLFNTDVSKVQDIYRRYLPEILTKLLFVLLSLTLMAMIDYRLTGIMLVSFGLYYSVGPYLEKKTMNVVDEGDRLGVQTDKHLYNLLSGLAEVRAFGSERWKYDGLMQLNRASARNVVRFWAVWSSRDAFRRLTYHIGAVAVFIYGAHLIREDSLTIGAFIAFVLYYFNALLLLTNIVTEFNEQRALLVHVRRLYRFMRLEPLVAEPELPLPLIPVRGEIELDRVGFGYPQQPDILRDLTLHIRAGEKVALVGLSGNGKSTVLKLLGRFYDPGSGEIRLDGVPLSSLCFTQLREAIGFVFQETYLFGASVKENIRFGCPEATDAMVEAAAKAANADEFIRRLPQQYDTPVGERGVKLSGGQKQRIAIARMLIKNPAILLLDEATSALDQTSEREVQQSLEVLMRGRTTIAVAHRLSTIREYDRIVVLQEGTVAEQGTYAELVERKQLFYRLLEGEAAAGEDEAHES